MHDEDARMGRVVASNRPRRLDATGRDEPVGHTVRWLKAVGSVAVTFMTTPVTPAVGTRPGR